ncbi:MAG: serine hydrolase [Zetaproteobacteria bacterium CG_4_9_14_3_um_filter_53_7]|nr:MAG: serine hydrolase [Zetaproteobacteria bacterium CG_4_9_14_3_um_filter_53_7]
MARKSRFALKLWFRLISSLLFFMLIPHKSTAVEHDPMRSHHKNTTVSKSKHPLLRESANADMQLMLEQRIASLHLTKAIKDKRLSVALVDVTDPSAPSMAQVNGDEMMYAASLPKIAILLAAFERISEGKLPLDENLRKTMTSMIRHSSNKAATEVLNKVGGEYINTVLSSPKYRLYDPHHNGGLWVGKEYGSGKAYHRDPLHQLSHGATATQVARYYYLLETGQLVSPKYSSEMKTILSKPGISHKFVKGLQADYPDVQMYRKSGTWRSYHADSALIEHDGHRYIAVALANDPKGGEWMKKLIHEMDEIIVALHEPDAAIVSAHADVLPVSGVQQPSSSSEHLM